MANFKKYTVIGIIALSFGFIHYKYVSNIFENHNNFSHLSDLEREMVLRTEMGFYYSYYKTIVEEEPFIAGISKLMYDKQVEYPKEVNAFNRFNIHPEVILGTVYRYLEPLLNDSTKRDCHLVDRGEGHTMIESCTDIGQPMIFYLEAVWWLAGLTVGALFLHAVTLSGSIAGGGISIIHYFANHMECTRVQWAPNERENMAMPLLLLQTWLLTLQLRDRNRRPILGLQISIFILNCLCLLFWQFTQFIFLTQMAIFFFMEQIRIIDVKALSVFLHSHFCGLHMAVLLLQGNDMLKTSLYTSFFLVVSMYCLFFSSFRIQIRNRWDILLEIILIVIRIAIVLSISFGVKKLLSDFLGVQEDSHIWEILYSKFTSYKTFHTLIYTCSDVFDFLPWSSIRSMLISFLIPISVLNTCYFFNSVLIQGVRRSVRRSLRAPSNVAPVPSRAEPAPENTDDSSNDHEPQRSEQSRSDNPDSEAIRLEETDNIQPPRLDLLKPKSKSLQPNSKPVKSEPTTSNQIESKDTEPDLANKKAEFEPKGSGSKLKPKETEKSTREPKRPQETNTTETKTTGSMDINTKQPGSNEIIFDEKIPELIKSKLEISEQKTLDDIESKKTNCELKERHTVETEAEESKKIKPDTTSSKEIKSETEESEKIRLEPTGSENIRPRTEGAEPKESEKIRSDSEGSEKIRPVSEGIKEIRPKPKEADKRRPETTGTGSSRSNSSEADDSGIECNSESPKSKSTLNSTDVPPKPVKKNVPEDSFVKFVKCFKVDPAIFYNIVQMIAFAMMAGLVMRLKLLFTTQMCLIASLATRKTHYYVPDAYKKFLPLMWVIFIAPTLRALFRNVHQEYSFVGEFSDYPQEQLLQWITHEADAGAFAGSMPILASVLVSTRKNIVVHPHYEHLETRQRAYAVYKVYGRFKSEELYQELSALEASYLIVEHKYCYGRSNKACSFGDIWDIEEPSLAHRPLLCHTLLTEPVEHFYPVFRNSEYAVFRVHDVSVRYMPRSFDT